MRHDVMLRNNIIETFDTWLNPFQLPTYEHSFFDVAEIKNIVAPGVSGYNTDTVMLVMYWLDEIETTHQREIYNLLDLVGDLGGTLGFFTALVGVLV